MPRPPRIHVAGALYYVSSRAGASGVLFKEEADYEVFLGLVNNYRLQFGFRLYTYLLLPGQVHLVMEPASAGEKTVSDIMHALNSRYSKFFTKKYGQDGHLFQGRYKSAVVEKGPFLLHLASYLHLFPVMTGQLQEAAGYRWSSIGAYLGKEDPSGLELLNEAEETLTQFRGENPALSYDQYLRAMSEAEWTQIGELLRQRVVGSENFVVSVEEKARQAALDSGLKDIAPALQEAPLRVEPALPQQVKVQRSAHGRQLAVAAGAAILFVTVGMVGLSGGRSTRTPAPPLATKAQRAEVAAKEKNARTQPVSFVQPLRLEGTVWEVQMKPMSVSGNPALKMDELTFGDKKLSSSQLTSLGFSDSNYTENLHVDGTLRWETMQKGPSEEMVFWRGEWRGNEMRGIYSYHPKGGTPQDYVFIGVRNDELQETRKIL